MTWIYSCFFALGDLLRSRVARMAIFCCMAMSMSVHAATSARQIIGFDKNWRFVLFENLADDSRQIEPSGLEHPDYDDTGWRRLDVPHDWAIEGPFQLELPGNTGKRPFAGVGWYRKHFTLDKADQGKRVSIQFDGAMSHARVWLNGTYVGQWPYGYNSFHFDLTEAVRFGRENVLAVRLDNPPDSSRWYPGAGIYRHVRLILTDPVHVAHWGTFVTTPMVSRERARIDIRTEVKNQSRGKVILTLRQDVYPKQQPDRIVAQSTSIPFTLASGVTQIDRTSLDIVGPLLWDIEQPNLYSLRTTVLVDDGVRDVYHTTFGIRKTEFNPDKGFLLNGRHVPLRGVCLHHDLGPLGSAFHLRAQERQLELLREMGCNAIRTAHNPPAPQLLDLCNRMGFLVVNEAFDCWARGKRKNDYGTLFAEWHERDIRNLARRDRNHPSVIMWSSGNEVREQGDLRNGHALSRKLTGLFHQLDPTRPVTVGCNAPAASWNGFAQTMDVFGFNYKPHLYESFHRRYPDKLFYSSESSSCVSTRGEYFFPVSLNKAEGFFNFQVSSYDLYAPPWAMAPDIEFAGLDENAPYAAGEFVWTGFDYLGEPTPYNQDRTNLLNFHNEAERRQMEQRLQALGGKMPSRSSYFGILDLCGFKKDRFYIYQARWRPDLPMAHILPHWNWPERVGKVTPVHVYTSGDQAELFLNGKSLGKRTRSTVDNEKRYISLSTQKPVSVSSEESDRGNWARKGNDGDLGTRWCASGESPHQYWQVDLGHVQDLRACVIHWEQNARQYQYELEGSGDGSEWIRLAGGDFEGREMVSVHRFDTRARFVRVRFTGLRSGAWASFHECQLYADEPPLLLRRGSVYDRYRLRWNDVVYQPGELKVVVTKAGRFWAEVIKRTTGKPAALRLLPDRTILQADGRDLCYFTAQIVDAQGQVVPRTHHRLQFTIDGPGDIIATGNGDPTNLESFQNTERNAFHGLCLAIVRSRQGQAGTVTVNVSAKELTSASAGIQIEAK